MMNISHSTSTSDLSVLTNAPSNDSSLEGVAASIKLLLKLIEDHKDACAKEQKDSRRMLRVAGMMTILDMVKSRIQKCQTFGLKRPMRELRRCNTDLRGRNTPQEKNESDQPTNEKEQLKKQINSSVAARKSLEVMCSSLGKEKEIMAHELARKAQDANSMEDYIHDLKSQNQTLLEKVHEYAAVLEENHEEKHLTVDEATENEDTTSLREHNKELSEQLLKSRDRCESIKRKLQEAQEENKALRGVFEEMGVKVDAGQERLRLFKQRVSSGNDPIDNKEEIADLEYLFKCFDMMVSKYRQNVHLKDEVSASKP